jgi:hypothetical protein
MADIRIDTSRLTYRFFQIRGQTPTPIDGTASPTLSLAPGSYTFQQGGPTFNFQITASGVVDYDAANDQFLTGRGTALSHDLTPVLSAGRVPLTRDAPHVLHLVPGRYAFAIASGAANFTLDLTPDGQVRFTDPALEGCAHISGRTVTITGYTITFDLTGLSHDMRASLSGNAAAMLTRGGGPQPLTLVPGRYAFAIASGAANRPRGRLPTVPQDGTAGGREEPSHTRTPARRQR